MKLPEQEPRHFIALYSALIGWCSGRLDPKGKVRDVQGFLAVEMAGKADARDRMLDNPQVIDEFLAENPYNCGPDDLAVIGAWRNFVRGDLVVERDLKKHTVFLDWIDEPIAYAVLSLTEELIDLVPSPLPVVVEAVLLPWRGLIVCDGMIRYKAHLGPGIRRRVQDAYKVARERGIVTGLGPEAKPEPESKKNSRTSKASARKGSTIREKPAQPGKAFLGKWRIVEMDAFDEDYFETSTRTKEAVSDSPHSMCCPPASRWRAGLAARTRPLLAMKVLPSCWTLACALRDDAAYDVLARLCEIGTRKVAPMPTDLLPRIGGCLSGHGHAQQRSQRGVCHSLPDSFLCWKTRHGRHYSSSGSSDVVTTTNFIPWRPVHRRSCPASPDESSGPVDAGD